MNNVAHRVIAKAGGAALVALDAGVSIVSVHRWTYDEAAGGTGGHIPARRQQAILLGARARGKDVRPEDFFDLPEGLPPLGPAAANDNAHNAANDNSVPPHGAPALQLPSREAIGAMAVEPRPTVANDTRLMR